MLIDNAESHPGEEELLSEDGKIVTMFLPPNCIALLQPMEQNVIQNIKTSYRKSLLVRILSEDTDIKDGLKNSNMKDVVFWLAESCPVNLIKKSWHPLRVSPDQYEWEEEDNLPLSQWIQTQDNEDVLTPLINQISQGGNLSPTIVREWVEGKYEDLGNETLTDNEIIEQSSNDDNVNDEDMVVKENGREVPHTEAVKCFNTCLRWADENGMSAEEIMQLRLL